MIKQEIIFLFVALQDCLTVVLNCTIGKFQFSTFQPSHGTCSENRESLENIANKPYQSSIKKRQSESCRVLFSCMVNSRAPLEDCPTIQYQESPHYLSVLRNDNIKVLLRFSTSLPLQSLLEIFSGPCIRCSELKKALHFRKLWYCKT